MGQVTNSCTECRAAVAAIDAKLQQLCRFLDEFPADRLWTRPRPGIASLGNLVCHVAGSMRDWFENGLGRGAWQRDRDAEFQRDGALSRQELTEHLWASRRHCQPFLDAIDEAALDSTRQFRGKTYTAREILLHQLDHVAYHAGQAAFLRWLVGGLEPKPL
jgi:uncharacterized damage-inducible protein DinB